MPLAGHEQYWIRLGRALLLVTAAVALHGWLIRPSDGPPGSAVRSLPGPTITAGASLAGGSARPVAPPQAGDAVSLRFEIVRVRPLEPRPVADAQMAAADATPVGTTGSASPAPEIMTAGATHTAVGTTDLQEVTARAETGRAEAPIVLSAAHMEASALPRELPGVTAPPLARLTRVPVPADTTVARVAAAPKVPEAGADLSQQKQIVLQILQEYQQAFQRLDVRAAKAVWPSLDDRKLRRAFQQLDRQELRFASCDVVSISGRDANASCRGDLTYRPKVGSRAMTLTEREWTFNLSRADEGWQIVNATIH